MSKKFLKTTALTTLIALCITPSAFSDNPTLPSPPQFVAFAFDNCDEPAFWQETLDFSKQLNDSPQMRAQNQSIHFTYFMSGVYFLTQQNKHLYTGPHHNSGASDIGFAPNSKFISDRIQAVNKSLEEGQEIGSHAVGHFDASQWTEDDWTNEFTAFYDLIKNVFVNNKMTPEPLNLNLSEIKGFRTPYLSYSAGLWPTLNKFHYRYDTSKTSQPNYWPQKLNGIWNFPLAELTIAGTAKKTLSMDYNFYVAQSRAKENVADADVFTKQMYDTYMSYFASNYNGNRAPVHIGHHFKQMNGGAYWRAMKAFAQTVCALPEVQCVTYSKLADYMDSQTPQALNAYSKGTFVKHPQINLGQVEKSLQLKLDLMVNKSGKISMVVGGKDKANSGVTYKWKVENQNVTALAYLDGREILSATRKVSTDQNGHVKASDKLEDRALLGDLPEAH